MNSDQIKKSIEIAAYDLNQNAVVNFADQLATANELAEQVQSEKDLESLQLPLFNHPDQHMRKPDNFPLFMVREFIYNTSKLVIATVTAPLAHIDFALSRNLSILDSFEIL